DGSNSIAPGSVHHDVRCSGNILMKYALPFLQRRRLHDRAYHAQQRDQSEVCGALMCTRSGVLRLHFLENRSERPGHFEIASADLRALRQSTNVTGLSFFGTFHSHPITYAVPGKGDIRGATTG